MSPLRAMPPLVAALCAALAAQQPEPFDAAIRPLLRETCFDCHAGAEPDAGLDLRTLAELPEHRRLELTLRVRNRVARREMPPLDWGELDAGEVARFVRWADACLDEALPRLDLDPGAVTMRRLSRVEYENALRDLLGVSTGLAADLPPDQPGYGFDNIGDVASFSTLHAEKYLAAAADVAAQVVDLCDPERPRTIRTPGAELRVVRGPGSVRGGRMTMVSDGTVRADLELARAGRYAVTVVARGDQAGDEPVRMVVAAGGREPRFDVEWEVPARFSFETELDARAAIDVSFVNDHYDPSHPLRRERDRNLVVEAVEIRGPLDLQVPPGSAWLRALDPGAGVALVARVEPLARELAARAWRRPPDDAAVARLCAVAAAVAGDGSFPRALRAVVEAVLVSPRFLYRVELPGDRALDGHELATRLSFFVWSSIPDRRLRELATEGRLAEPGVLAAEARRMLRDPRAAALATVFAAQWLELRNLEATEPDPARFPEFDEALRASMRRETELVFEAVLREGRSAHELLGADFTFVDARLARLYGLDGAFGDALQRVPAPRPGGIAGHASVLTVTSDPTRTSPVKRGRWILDNLLDAPPPPPQPGFDSFADESAVAGATATMREQLAIHRQEARCAVCHVRMDGLGLALERFDAIGRRRDREDGAPIDASGTLPGGRRIEDLDGLAAVLAGEPAFLRALAHKLFVFAVGRDTTVDDRLALERLVRSLPGAATTIEDLVLGIVQLEAFRRIRSGGVER